MRCLRLLAHSTSAARLRSMSLASIRCVLCDVDGVLTSGALPFTADGQGWKTFSVRDGHLLKATMLAGIRVGVVSGRASEATDKRCKELGLDPIHLGVGAKIPVYERILTDYGLRDDQVMFIGDDIPDLAVMQRCGYGVAVGDANPAVKKYADWVCNAGRPGRRG